mmetsp:Transcript_43914/g.92411  ORF Transcript_43914/g.92411 Transcript_43914/m.92411 type:complete len:737 (+) Transcript_43914:172-2382(+)|eukprot:CAMPEP_0183729626 /NCGR_PEP_ID=MMETSP0737-20130205/30762_1 /TAXON_ID=385413 /ORGANISM="Thalassiosira miniscula, Strain CCMP1093" /LENGTH=736 /DNA_ID=CAMNT_0025961861 /DNA_START=73 /DNA_END=2283 /DNA_ORIENTATION=+
MASCTNSSGGSFLHDLSIFATASILTCAAIATYNYYIDRKVEQLMKESKEHEKNEEEVAPQTRPLLRKAQGSYSSISKPTNKSIASSLARVEGIEASGNFLSGILGQLWPHLNVAISNIIKDTVEPILKDLPVPIHFVKMDLGNVPIETRNMFIRRVDPDSSSGKAGVGIDMDVLWDGDCDILLQATITSSLKVTFGIKKLKLAGRLDVLLSGLTTDLPVISAVQYAFSNVPKVELAYTGLAGSLTSKIKYLESTILNIVEQSLAGILVLPNRMVLPMDLGTYDFFDTYYPPVGMVRVTAVEARGFKVQKGRFMKDIPDCYVMISLGASKFADPPFKTSVKKDSLNPVWNEAGDFILYDLDQEVYIEVWDKDKEEDDRLGNAKVAVRDLFDKDGAMELPLELGGEKNGCFITIRADLHHLSSQKVGSFSSPSYAGKNQLCGLATILVTKAFDIPIPKEDAACNVKIIYGKGGDFEKTFYTPVVMDYPGIDALNPMFNSVYHIPITAAMLSDKTKNKTVTFILVDNPGANGTKAHGELGTLICTLDEVISADMHMITKTSFIGNKGAKLEYRISLNGMLSEDEQTKSMSSTQNLTNSKANEVGIYGGIDDKKGVTLRLTAVRGRGFQIQERKGKKDDVPDVYCSVRLANSKAEWKTRTIKDDTMPNWNESNDFHVNPLTEVVEVSVYEANSKGLDELLGNATFTVEKLLRKRVMEAEIKEGSGMFVKFMGIKIHEAS